MDARADNRLQLAHRDVSVLHLLFELEHGVPLERFGSLEPSLVVRVARGRIGQELRERSDVGLAALHQVFLGSSLLLDRKEAVLGFLHHALANGIGIVLEFGLEFGDRGCQSGLLELFVQENLANEGAEHVATELSILLIFKVLVLELVLLKHLDAGIEFRIRNLVVVHDAHRVALRSLRYTVHSQKAHDNTCRENDNDPLGFLINPR